jgi:hypothetical protein
MNKKKPEKNIIIMIKNHLIDMRYASDMPGSFNVTRKVCVASIFTLIKKKILNLYQILLHLYLISPF